MDLVLGTNQESMTSRYIAKITGTEHSNVLKKIRKIISEIANEDFTQVNFDFSEYKDESGKKNTEITMTKSGSLFIASRYDVNLHLAVQLRWEELEKASVPQTFVQALRLAADNAEKLELAIATKAEIGNRREATAMNTASTQTKRANKLEIELDASKDYCTIKRMQMLNHGIKFNWRLLKSTGVEMDIETKEVFDANYGTVKSYNKDVWKEAYGLDF